MGPAPEPSCRPTPARATGSRVPDSAERGPWTPSARPGRERLLLGAASVGALVVHALCFSRFFPSPAGEYGHDYALNMPKLLAGYFWYLESGLAVPWFTPAFCGGVPLLADPQSLYYSLTQLLTLRFDPFTSTWLTFALADLRRHAQQADLLLGLDHAKESNEVRAVP